VEYVTKGEESAVAVVNYAQASKTDILKKNG
jgi:hypothetical protein